MRRTLMQRCLDCTRLHDESFKARGAPFSPWPKLPSFNLIAKLENVPGIEAECGGACACATCHVYIAEGWREKTGAPSGMEEDMLDFAFDVRTESRPCCQIKVTEELDGLIVQVPAKQC